MAKILLSISFVVLLIYSCGPKKVSYEDATKWYSECILHPSSHLGDVYAYWDMCTKECKSKINANNDSTSLPNESSQDSGSIGWKREIDKIYAMRINKLSCIRGCIEKINPIAMHIEGGYYSDGSYYAMCFNPFENIHPTKDKYEQTQWQKDRDECMQLTYENVKQGFWSREPSQGYFYAKWLKRANKYYKGCLRERGYKIKSI